MSVNIEPTRDLKIDLVGNRLYSENLTENYKIEDINTDGILDYNALTPNTFGNFSISTLLIKTAFSKSDENTSDPFNDFRDNRLVVARRLAVESGIDMGNPANFEDNDLAGFPKGEGSTRQSG